jgi:hypothetical protein
MGSSYCRKAWLFCLQLHAALRPVFVVSCLRCAAAREDMPWLQLIRSCVEWYVVCTTGTCAGHPTGLQSGIINDRIQTNFLVQKVYCDAMELLK